MATRETKLRIVGLLSPDEAENIKPEFQVAAIEFVDVQLFSDEPTREMVVVA